MSLNVLCQDGEIRTLNTVTKTDALATRLHPVNLQIALQSVANNHQTYADRMNYQNRKFHILTPAKFLMASICFLKSGVSKLSSTIAESKCLNSCV